MSDVLDDSAFKDIARSLADDDLLEIETDELLQVVHDTSLLDHDQRYWDPSIREFFSSRNDTKMSLLELSEWLASSGIYLGTAESVFSSPDSLKSHLTRLTPSNTSENTREQREISVAGYSIFYRSMWLVMALLSLAWGTMLGLRFAGSELLGPSTIATGSVVLVSLLLTLFVAGRRSSIRG